MAAGLLVLVVAGSAPSAFLWSQLRALAQRGETTAVQVAALVMQDARPDAALWRYDVLKLGSRLRAYRGQEAVERVEVTDATGRRVESGAPPALSEAGSSLLWRSAPITVDGEEVGRVWVALDVAESRLQALLLVLLFGMIGAAMVALMDWAQRETDARERLTLQLSRRALELQEAERRAIARELHDVTGQALTALRIDLELLKAAAGEEERAGLLARAISTTDGAVEDVRRTLQRLRAAVLDELGLQEALVRLGQAFQERHGVQVSIDVALEGDAALEGDVALAGGVALERVPLPPTVEVGCYRVCQEALTNVARHAGADTVEVSARLRDGELWLRVEDDGRGFEVATSEGAGLAGMRERVALLGGRLEIRSRRQGGTCLQAWLPVHDLQDGTAAR